MTEIILFSIMLAAFTALVSYGWIRYGIQHSISALFYVLPEKSRTVMFCLSLWGFAIPAMILGNGVLMFWAGTGICFVGAAAAYKEEMTDVVHISGAIMGIAFSQLAIIFQYKMWYVSVAWLVAVALIYWRAKHRTWWVELMSFISIAIVIGINIFK